MKKLTMIGMAALLVLAVSCKKDEKTNAVQGPGFRASLEIQAGNDKTHLEDGTKVKWDAGDAILVINSSNEAKEFATETGVMTDGYADFQSADATEGFYTPNYKAYYPSGLYNTTTGKISLPQTQQYAAGSFGKGFNPMAAQASDETLEFKNICGMLALQLKGNCTVSSIRITSKDDEMLWGEGDFILTGTDSGASLSLGTLSNGSASITLNCNNEVTLNTANATTFYFVLPNGALSSGFNVVLTDSNGKVWKKSASTNTEIHQNKIRKMSELSVGTVDPVLPTVTTASGCIDCNFTLGGSVTVSGTQVCEYGFVFAKTSENSNPTIGGENCIVYTVNTETLSGMNDYTISIEELGLEPGVMYTVKPYAIIDAPAYGTAEPVALPAPWPTAWTAAGHSTYKYTVGSGKQVYFSRGNLQYNAIGATATAASGQSVGGTWRFAEHQYEFIGNDNSLAGPTYTGWMDLFSWGASGYNHGAQCYQPWAYNIDADDQVAPNLVANNAYGDNAKHLYSNTPSTADWGYNAISNGGNTAGSGWRTLTKGEWDYLLESRSNASNLRGYGRVGNCEIPGMIILPDGWTSCPDGLSFSHSVASWADYYSHADWAKMEAAGAIFLPAAGDRGNWSLYGVYDLVMEGVKKWGWYWTSENTWSGVPGSSHLNAFLLSFGEDEYGGFSNPETQGYWFRNNWSSVRLVKDAN